MRVLVLGASGMLGNAVVKVFATSGEHEVWATIRSHASRRFFAESPHLKLITSLNVLDEDALLSTFADIRPEVVINCVGVIKQLGNANDPLVVLPINAMLPHRLARLCRLMDARLIHVSTDCVFSGRKGNYVESDLSDAEDLYGKSKFIGELHDDQHAITLRTSIIGHELNSHHALVDWFLNQQGKVRGYTRAIFSGLPTFELARVMLDYVLPHPELYGLYHVSAAPIAKYDLLGLIAKEYAKEIEIEAYHDFEIDRSLDSGRFSAATGYCATDWSELIAMLHNNYKREIKPYV